MSVRKLFGMKYPDEYFIKFFFKHGLHRCAGKLYCEPGCGNGSNLTLPYDYGNDVIGFDVNEELTRFANDNFGGFEARGNYTFFCEDMRDAVCKIRRQIDVLVLANSIYYISEEELIKMLQLLREKCVADALFFLRFRTPEDYRYGKGKSVGHDAFILENGVTGEDGAFCRFYQLERMQELLKKQLGAADMTTLRVSYENIQNDTVVKNDDVVIWGKTGA